MAEVGGRSAAATRPARLHYAWVVTIVAFVTLLVAAGIRAAPGILIVPLEQEFGWTRASISFAVGLQLLVFGLIGPFSAGLVDRFGLRWTMIGGMTLTIAGYGATLLVSAAWQLWLIWGVIVGLGTGSVALLMAAILANRWFVKRRGLAMGVLTGSAAAGQTLFVPLLANVVTHVSWRASVIVACAAGAAVIPLVVLFVRDRPADVGLRPYGMAADAAVPPVPPRANPVAAAFSLLGQAVGSRDFWLLSASFFACGATTFGLIGTHFIPACLDHGISEASAANVLAIMGVCNVIGTTSSGWLTDRFDSRYLLFWYYSLRGVALLFLPFAFDYSFTGLTVFGVFFGFDWITTVPPTVRLTTNIFGVEKAGIMYGWIMVMHQIGAAVTAYLTGLVRTEYGDYVSAYIVSGLLCFIASLIVLRIGRPSSAPRRPVLAAAEA